MSFEDICTARKNSQNAYDYLSDLTLAKINLTKEINRLLENRTAAEWRYLETSGLTTFLVEKNRIGNIEILSIIGLNSTGLDNVLVFILKEILLPHWILEKYDNKLDTLELKLRRQPTPTLSSSTILLGNLAPIVLTSKAPTTTRINTKIVLKNNNIHRVRPTDSTINSFGVIEKERSVSYRHNPEERETPWIQKTPKNDFFPPPPPPPSSPIRLDTIDMPELEDF